MAGSAPIAGSADIAGSAIVQTGHWSPAKRRALPTHRNEGVEVVYIDKGRLRWHVEGQVETVPPGSVFFTLPWQAHGSVEQAEPNCELYYVIIGTARRHRRPVRRFGFDPALGIGAAAQRRITRVLGSVRRHCWPANPRIAWLLPQLVAEQQRPDRSAEAITALARLALVELVRCIEGEAPPPPAPAAEGRVQAFLAELAGRVDEPWTLEAMARACGLGRTRFADLVKRLTGETPVMALNRLRIARAQALLRHSEASITDIAQACGFSTSQYFAGVFRDYTGCSASAYRARACQPAETASFA